MAVRSPSTRPWRRPSPRRRTWRLFLERLEDRTLLCGTAATSMAAILPIKPTDAIAETISRPGEVDSFKIALTEPGRLTVRTGARTGSSLDSRTSLLDSAGQLLIQSDGQSASNRDDLITQHLLAGTYFLRVEGLRGGTGAYTVSTQFEPANPPSQSLRVNFDHDYPFGLSPWFHIVGDFNRDGTPDIATANTLSNDVTVLLGMGDGTFDNVGNFGVGIYPLGIVAGDFNGDGRMDLATANQLSNDVSILLGQGDGAFANEVRIAAGTGAWGLYTGDLNGDGRLDLAIANAGSNDLSVLLGRGDGTFQPETRFPTGLHPSYLAVGDFNGDGHLDLATANFNSFDLSVLLGKGDGSFQPEVRVGSATYSGIITGDFNGDGKLDLAAADSDLNGVEILLGNGNGTFQTGGRWKVGPSPYAPVAVDFNHDGHIDLATANRQSNDVSVLLGRGDGTFNDEVRYRAGLQSVYLVSADFNGDGQADLATANERSHDVSILLGLGDGTFQEDLTDPRQGETNPQGTVLRDFNGDGHLDLAVVTYTGHDVFVFLGRGDGTFQNRMRFQVGSTPVGLVAADFNEDGRQDLASVNCDSSNVSILLGRGDGTFLDQVRYPASPSGEFILTGDFNGDGHIDLVTSGQFANGIAVNLGRGDGTFQPPLLFGLGDAPAGGAAGDFNGDGRLDLAVTNFFSPDHDISVFLGNGDGTFENETRIAVGDGPLGIVADDFNGDGRFDLVVTNSGSQSVSLLLGRGDGTFQNEVRFATETGPDHLIQGDFNHDGQLDLAVSNARSTNVSLLVGRGDGTFADQVPFALGDAPTPRRGLSAGDVNGDGLLDLATTQVLPSDVAVLLGRGDGTFQTPLQRPVGLGPAAFTTGDFNNDSRLDVASINPTTDEATVSLGVGDATLQSPIRLATGTAPAAVLRGDFNRDGRLDLAIANYGSNDVWVLLGLGDGKFRQEVHFVVGTNPTALTTGDFNGDGRFDLATANAGSNDVSVLLGRGDGTFQSQVRLEAADLPEALVTGDFNGDGSLDLATANYRSQDIAMFLGRGNGTFQAARRIALGTSPVSLIADDLNGDGRLDLATANLMSNDVSVLLGRGDGTFKDPVQFSAGTNPVYVTSSDFNDDGRLDLATANSTSKDVTLLLGRGDGTFADRVQRPVGDYAVALAGADFTNDGRTDLVIATQLASEVPILQGLGDMRFVPGGSISNPIHATPLVADWNGDGLADVAVINRQGQILLRLARRGIVGDFEAPVVVNADPRAAARDLAVVSSTGGFLLAALDAKSSSVSFYSRRLGGTFARTAGPAIPGTLAVSIAAGDLNGDGRNDLVVADAGSNQVFIYRQNKSGGFGPAPDYQLGVGISPSALDLVDVDNDGRLEIVVTNQFSGDVSVLHNEASGACLCESRFRAGTGLYWLDHRAGDLAVRSREGTAGLVAGNFDADPHTDLMVVNTGTNSFSVLRGNGDGGFDNPARAQTYATGLRPTVVAAGPFNNDPYVDVAVLNEGSADVSIYLGDGAGGFVKRSATDPQGRALPLSAGNAATGLAARDINGDGKVDLLVGNDFGDLLALLGNGDGTFQPYQRADRNIALAVADLNGDGKDDFIFANEALDHVAVQYSRAGQGFTQDRTNGLLAPGAVSLADLNRDGIADLLVANSGANNVLVYLGLGNGQFGPVHSFFAGTNPAGITVKDLNADRLPDLVVANEGSNDATILLGQGVGATWTLANGPRLRAGAGPVQSAVEDVTGDGIPDILIANSQSNNVFLLRGLGGGFFADQSPIEFPAGIDPRQVFAGNFDGQPGVDLVTVNAGSNDLTFFSNLGAGRSIGAGGERPVAAVSGDFNGDGLSDLLVANNGDGQVALLLGAVEGPTLARLFPTGDLLHPTDLALSADGSVFYVVNEGEEAVARFALDFGIALPIEPGRAGTDFLPLTESALATVAVPLTSAVEPVAASIESGEATLAIGVLLASATFDVGGGDDENHVPFPLDEDATEIHMAPSKADDLPGFVIGLEEAFERNGREIRQALFHPRERALSMAELDALFREATATWLPAAARNITQNGQLLADMLLDVLKPGATLLSRILPSLGLSESLLPDSGDEPEDAAAVDGCDNAMLLHSKVEMADLLASGLVAAFFTYEPIRKRRQTSLAPATQSLAVRQI